MKYSINKEQQLKELNRVISPIVNVNIVIHNDWKYLIGRRPKSSDLSDQDPQKYLFPGSRMKFDETIQEAALRVLAKETPGVKAIFKKTIATLDTKGNDKRAYAVSIYVLMDYLQGSPIPNASFDRFEWVSKDDFIKLDYNPTDYLVFDEIDTAVRSMNTTEDEILTEVDKNDIEIGQIIKREAHNTNSRYHRAAHIMLFNSKGEVVLQRRGLNKIHSPGRWDMPGGHNISGQHIDQTAKAELFEEMGIETELTFVYKHLSVSPTQLEWSYLYYGIHDGPYDFDEFEVAQIQAFNCKQLLMDMEKHTEILNHVFKYIKDLQFVWEPLSHKK